MQELYSLGELLVMLITDPRTGILFALLVVASVIDYRTYRIPNWLTMSGAAFALAYSVVTPFSPTHGFFWALGGFAAGLLTTLPLYALKAMGAGDVKLLAMVGAFVGLSDVWHVLASTFIVGGAAALMFAAYHRVLGRMMLNIKTSVQTIMLTAAAGMKPHAQVDARSSVGKLPYGVSIAIGTMSYVVMKQLGYV